MAVKSAKRLAQTIKFRDLLEAAGNGDRSLLEELKKSISRKSTSQSVPESLDGKVGHDDILGQFKSIYEDLYNSVGNQEPMNGIKT